MKFISSILKIFLLSTIILCSSLNISWTQISISVSTSYFLSFNRGSEIKYDDQFDFLTYSVRFLEEDISPVFGVSCTVANDLVYVRGGIHLRQLKSRFRSINYLKFPDLTPQFLEKKSNTLLIPIEAGLRVDNFNIGAGPSIVWHYSTQSPFNQLPEFEERERKISGGYHISFNYELNKLQLEILYEQRFHGVAEDIYYRGDEKSFKQSSQYLGLMMSYRFELN